MAEDQSLFVDDEFCRWCWAPLFRVVRPQGGGQQRRYCSDAHRQAYHRHVRLKGEKRLEL